MQPERSPFLDGALAWLYTADVPDRCERCGYECSTDAATALQAIATSPALWALPSATATFVALSEQLDASTPFLHGDWGPGTVGAATSIRAFDDDMLLINMSVWESIDTLAAFVYRSAHLDVMRQRGQWFEKMADATAASEAVPDDWFCTT